MVESLEQNKALLNVSPSPADRLEDGEVKKFFLGILRSDLPAEQKYEKFVEFFRLDSSLTRELASRGHELKGHNEETVQQVLATAAQNAGVWKPQEILAETKECLGRAVRRLLVSQHRDGGWGHEVEVSSIWETVYGAHSLYMAEKHGLDDRGLRQAYERGLDWLMSHRDGWSVEVVPPGEERSIYELSAVIRCLYEVGRGENPEIRTVVSACIARLEDAQNEDGGWDRSIWGSAWQGPTRTWSETGATSFALQALAVAGGERRRPAVLKGIDRLASAQNDDGSWSIMIFRQLDRGARSVTKTCDALKGILAGRRIDIDLTPYQEKISKGVEYLQRREQPIFNDARRITGWGWYSDDLGLVENTCHTLETLLKIKEASLPLLTSNAAWLIGCQFKDQGNLDEGKWANSETGRITLALLQFYEAIKASPLFAPTVGDPSSSVSNGPGDA